MIAEFLVIALFYRNMPYTIDKAMNDLFGKVRSGTKGFAQKTGEILGAKKLQIEIKSLKKRIRQLHHEIGVLAVERYVNGEHSLPLSNGAAHDLIKETQIYKQTIHTLEEKLRNVEK